MENKEYELENEELGNEIKEDIGYGCGEAPEEDAGCDCSEESPETNEEDDECGCGEGNPETPEEEAGCGCGVIGNIEYPDLSKFNNPDKPNVIVDDDFIQEFEIYAYSLGISSIGFIQVTPDVLIQNKFIQYPNAIVLTMEMDKKIIETAPGEEANDLNNTAYVRLGILTTKLSDYLREKGYSTEIAYPDGGIVNFSLLGQYAGLGYVGNNGLLITPEFGPRVKISAVLTSIANLPLNDGNEYSWIPEYCNKCGKCVKACPEEALIEKQLSKGIKEIEFRSKQCIGCNQGCTYCIEDCPFEEKGYEHVKNRFDKLSAKLKENK